MASHSGSESYACLVCRSGFFTERILKRHIARRHADTTDAKCLCNIYGKANSKNWLLTEHMDRTHSSEKKICCKICGKTYKQGRSLREHEETHNDETSPKFECDKCDKKFRIQRYLRDHLNKIHGPEDKKRERLQKKAQQDRARRHKKRMDQTTKTSFLNSPSEDKCFETNYTNELNSITAASEIPENPTKLKR